MCFGGSAQEIEPTKDQIAQQQVNARLWDHYVQNYKPMIQKYAAQSTDPTIKKGEANQVAGQINAEVMKNATAKSPGNAVANTKKLMDVASSKTTAEETGAEKVASKQASNTQNIIDIGRGQATQADTAMGSLAQQSIQSEITGKELSMQEAASAENAVGSAVGGVAAGINYGLGKNKKSLTPQGQAGQGVSYSDDMFTAYQDQA